MVSKKTLLPFLLTVSSTGAIGQTPTPAAFRADNHTETSVMAPKPLPPSSLSPEMRGDILMARKMYREAIETYSEGRRIRQFWRIKSASATTNCFRSIWLSGTMIALCA